LFAFFMALSLATAVTDGDVPDHVECVPVARQISGIQIFGNALTWWKQAEGHYARGNMPKKGAVLAFKPYGAMTLGHVAAVTKIIDDRTILVTHANWSVIDGRRGQIERDVRVVDVSDEGDWSKVRVWYASLEDLGTTQWPVHGFIYPGAAPLNAPKLQYASVINFEPKTVKQALPLPTGRLAYLGKVLTRLK
jgi:surface antigen